MASLLVTGGAGFIGSHVADALLARGHRVTVLDDLSGGFRENVPLGGRPSSSGSVTDDALRRSTCSHATASTTSIHLAAYAAEGLSHFIKRFNYTNNVIGSVNLMNAAVNAGVKGFVFTSSIAVYGASPQPPMTEDDARRPGGLLWHRQTTRSSRSSRASRGNVRPRLRHLPAPQRLRRASEHRRPLPQRRRHLHEPDPAGPPDDDLRRRRRRRARSATSTMWRR